MTRRYPTLAKIAFAAFLAMVALLWLNSCTPMPTRTPKTATAPIPTQASITPTPQPSMTAFEQIAATMEPSNCTVETPNNEVLNVRELPNMDAPIIGGLLPGTRVEILTHGDWYQISYGEGVGYIHSEFCWKGR